MGIIEKMSDYLLQNASPSIVLRVRDEVCGDLDGAARQKLLAAVEQEKNMVTIRDSIREDGWIGGAFHGTSGVMQAGMYDNMEVGLRYCAEKGLPADHPIVEGAVQALLQRDRMDPVYRNMGKIPDYQTTALDLHLPRSSSLLRAGWENRLPPHDEIDLAYDITWSFEAFRGVRAIGGLPDITRPHAKGLVFADGVVWPCIYDLRILAFSRAWRREGHYAILGNCVEKLFQLPQDGPAVYTFAAMTGRKALMSPCFPFINRPTLEAFDEACVPAGWFDKMELFARCGIVHRIPRLLREYERLLSCIGPDGIWTLPVQKQYFQKWSPYYGLALEPDWKTREKRICDCTFRALMIIRYTEKYRKCASASFGEP